MQTKFLLSLLCLLLSASAAHAQLQASASWTQPFRTWWPAEVRVYCAADDAWTDREKATIRRTMEGYFWTQEKVPSTGRSRWLWFSSYEQDGRRYELVERPSVIRMVDSLAGAHVIIRMDAGIREPADVTSPAAGLPAVIRIRPDHARPMHRLVRVIQHECMHLEGAVH